MTVQGRHRCLHVQLENTEFFVAVEQELRLNKLWKTGTGVVL